MEAILLDTKPADSLRKLEEAIQNKNYVCAVNIAESIGKPAGEIRELKQRAIKEFQNVFCTGF